MEHNLAFQAQYHFKTSNILQDLNKRFAIRGIEPPVELAIVD